MVILIKNQKNRFLQNICYYFLERQERHRVESRLTIKLQETKSLLRSVKDQVEQLIRKAAVHGNFVNSFSFFAGSSANFFILLQMLRR